MGLKSEVLKAIQDVIGAAKVTPSFEVRASNPSDIRNFTISASAQLKSDYPEALAIDFPMLLIQTGYGLMTQLRLRLSAGSNATAAEAMADQDYVENKEGEEVHGYESVVPLIDCIFMNICNYLRDNTTIKDIVLRTDTYAPAAKARTQKKRRDTMAKIPYSAKHYRIDIKTGMLLHRETSQPVGNVDYGRLVFNRTSLLSQLMRAIIYRLSQNASRVHDRYSLPSDARFIFDFADVIDRNDHKREVLPVCLEVDTNDTGLPSAVMQSEYEPIACVGEADLGVVKWVERLGKCAVVLSGDGDQLPLLTYWMESRMAQVLQTNAVRSGKEEKKDDVGTWTLASFKKAHIPTVYMLKNRTAAFRIDHKDTSMYNINYAVQLMHEHGWSGDKLAMLAILATNDYFIGDDKAVLFPRIGLQCIADVLTHMTAEQVDKALVNDEAFRLFSLHVWLCAHSVTSKTPRKNAKKDPPKKSFDSAADVVRMTDSFGLGYDYLEKDTKTAKVAQDNMQVLLQSKIIKHMRCLVLDNINYWKMTDPVPEQFNPDPKLYTFTAAGAEDDN